MAAFVTGIGFCLTFYNAIISLRRGAVAVENPWGADTLEWATASPPENYNHRHLMAVHGRHPLWDEQKSGQRQLISGLRADRREVLITTILDAKPQAVVIMPSPTFWPFLLSLTVGLGFLGFMFYPILFVVGFFLSFFIIVGWLWPRRPWLDE